jgi:hypothetical protein
MKKLTKWADRKVTESTQPKDPTWEEKLKQKITELNAKLQSTLKQFK